MGDYNYIIKGGQAIIMRYFSEDTEDVVVPGEIEGAPVVALSGFCSPFLRSVVMPDSVIEIGPGTFSYCTNLESV